MKTILVFPTGGGQIRVATDSENLAGPLDELTREFLALTPLVEQSKVGTPHEGHDGWSSSGEPRLARCGCGEVMTWLYPDGVPEATT